MCLGVVMGLGMGLGLSAYRRETLTLYFVKKNSEDQVDSQKYIREMYFPSAKKTDNFREVFTFSVSIHSLSCISSNS